MYLSAAKNKHLLSMKKLLSILSGIVIILFFLSLYGWMVNHISKGDRNFGFLAAPIKYIYSFPDLFQRSVEQVKTLPETFVPTPKDLEPVNELMEDLLVLVSYSDKGDSRSIVLRNLLNDSILYKWNVENPFEEHSRIKHPVLMEDSCLIYAFTYRSGVYKIDPLGELIWSQDSVIAHHSMELDSNGDLWICSQEPKLRTHGSYLIGGDTIYYRDNTITKLDTETGRILQHESITQILARNGLSHYLQKSQVVQDPLHINDVQPALRTSPYYNEGDLFLSSRSASFIMQYRPSSGKVIRMIEGPFSAQHDVDLCGDSSLFFFNNNIRPAYWLRVGSAVPEDPEQLTGLASFSSTIAVYDFESGSTGAIWDSVFLANQIFTATEGLIEFIDPQTCFVEEQNSGLLWVIKNNEVVYKDVFRSQHEGYHHLPNWNRIIN